MRTTSLAEMLGGMSHEPEAQMPLPEAQMPLPEAQIMELHAALTRRARMSPFKRGDLITPMRLASFGVHGRPYVVLDVIEKENLQTFYPETGIGSQAFGFTPDLVIFGFSSPDHAGKVLVEGHDFELYDPAVHKE